MLRAERKAHMHVIQVSRNGGPEVLQYTEAALPQPGDGQALVKISAIGVNFIDVYHRTGRYSTPLPLVPGVEAAGVIESVGPGVSGFRAGDRVAWATIRGSYAEYAAVPVSQLVPIPPGVSEQTAAAVLTQGMTVHMLVTDVFPLKAGQTALVHAAAGGVGLLLTQTARRIGARVIATVSTEAKAQLAREAGAAEVILYAQADFEAEVKRLTDGAGVQVVYDSVGQTTFEKSLNCLRTRGMLVLYGAASGPAPMLDPNSLGGKGSLFVTRPSIFHYIAEREALLKRSSEVFNWVAQGQLKVRVGQTYPLAQATQAHRDLEGRATTGKLLLLP
jgi:NADPH2:quinone reductase